MQLNSDPDGWLAHQEAKCLVSLTEACREIHGFSVLRRECRRVW